MCHVSSRSSVATLRTAIQCTPCPLSSDATARKQLNIDTPSLNFYRPDVLPDAQPTVSKHWNIFVTKALFWNVQIMQDRYCRKMKHAETSKDSTNAQVFKILAKLLSEKFWVCQSPCARWKTQREIPRRLQSRAAKFDQSMTEERRT